MKIFYSKSTGSDDVKAANARECGVEEVLAIFHNLSPDRGFLGVQLDDSRVFQCFMYAPLVELELIGLPEHQIDRVTATVEQVEALIQAAGRGEDVFAQARQVGTNWERLE